MKKRIRIISFLLAFVMLTLPCLVFTSGSAASLGQQKNELESRLAALQSQSAQLKNQYNVALKDVNDQKTVVNLLYDQIETYQKELEALDALMIEYTALAAEKEKEIDRLNEQMNKNFELFKERLVFAQESGNMSYIDFILGSSDLSDIISRSEVINDMLEYDRKIIEGLLSDREAIEKAKEEIELALQNCREKQTEYDAIVVELKAKQAEAQEKLEKLKKDSEEAKTAAERADALKKQTEDSLDAVIKQIAAESKGTYNGGAFIWPLPLSFPGAISRGWSSTHSGVDIHVYGWANNGKIPALAIAAGTVVRKGYYSDWGNLIVVDHGGGYLSYYAHLDSFAVNYGQKVSQGQQVGKIGSTGRSTGPHLHLVIYAPVGPNGTSIRTDPMKYISYPR
ncbi:MAG: peptidoglycan DD-metalloendopeptidase family protein [Clostridia bacterium]|nr:peptidoglycan DD-metalloendopeptidase family protein [Clostridia bacterium]